MNNNLKITVEGVTGSGKSITLKIIVDALEKAGYLRSSVIRIENKEYIFTKLPEKVKV